MTSFEELGDEKAVEGTTIKPGLTGGEEDSGFTPSELDLLISVNKSSEGERKAQAPLQVPEDRPGELEFKEAA